MLTTDIDQESELSNSEAPLIPLCQRAVHPIILVSQIMYVWTDVDIW